MGSGLSVIFSCFRAASRYRCEYGVNHESTHRALIPQTPLISSWLGSMRAGRSVLCSGKIRAMSEALLILCTCPDVETATSLSRSLVTAKLAACVNIVPGIRSIYHWKGAINDDQEVLMVIKSLGSLHQELESWILENHPYDVPEVIALPVDKVSASYLAWIESSVGDE